jgi:YggT family protein
MRDILCTVLNLYVIAIVLRMVLSWFPLDPGGPVAQVAGVLRRITDPVLEPLRRALPPLGGLDLSPLIAILGLQLIVGRLILNC